jgi:hypothetical protein
VPAESVMKAPERASIAVVNEMKLDEGFSPQCFHCQFGFKQERVVAGGTGQKLLQVLHQRNQPRFLRGTSKSFPASSAMPAAPISVVPRSCRV